MTLPNRDSLISKLKGILIWAVLLTAAINADHASWYIEYGKDRQGYSTFKVVNTSKFWIYCTMEGDNFYRDAEIAPNKKSRAYYVPYNLEVECD